MKEHSDNKVPLVRMSQDDPLNQSNTKNDQLDSQNNNQGESNMIRRSLSKTQYFQESKSEQPSKNKSIPYTQYLQPELDTVVPQVQFIHRKLCCKRLVPQFSSGRPRRSTFCLFVEGSDILACVRIVITENISDSVD